jgi:predicted nucleic acid-binding protein
MRLFLDSTYLIPALNVDILEGWTKDDLKNLIQSEKYDLFYCDLSLFEIYTKCMKLILQKKLDVGIETVQLGIQSILNSPKISKINWWEHIFESEIFFQLKKIHNDSIDCMLIYLAMINCDIFATFDDRFINKIKENNLIKQFVEEVNPQFRIMLKNLSQESFRLFE